MLIEHDDGYLMEKQHVVSIAIQIAHLLKTPMRDQGVKEQGIGIGHSSKGRFEKEMPWVCT